MSHALVGLRWLVKKLCITYSGIVDIV
ncbi:hypothetical protein Bhyg_05086 [Pseudolycoriella hygida]|uniref:Uncharacterized protein n=1 Tax=Pseudolycoriella hygida TaxID=35572 RepID=A0A9Q0NGK6_9DIPT|nr:hypothetical protein Bhyg_05086 [Pseudolycoriella hygida]